MCCSPVMGYLFVGISVVDEDRVPTGGAPLIHIHGVLELVVGAINGHKGPLDGYVKIN